MDANFEHCAALVREADPDRFLASLFAPEVHRGALYALYAFNAEIGRVPEVAREPMPGEIRLQWWREVLAGERNGEEKAHPVAAALRETIEQYGIAVEPLADLIEAHAFDLYAQPMAAMNDLEIYAERTDCAVFALAADILGGRSVATSAAIRHAGIAYTVAGLLRSLARDASRRRLFVPLDVLARHGADVERIFAGEATAELRASLAELRLCVRRHLAGAAENISSIPDAILPALLPVALVQPALTRMEKNDYEPFEFTTVPRWRQQWRLWRAARNPGRIFS